MGLDRLPNGWTGKNWACWNGALYSSAEWILFVDADVRVAPSAVEAAIAEALCKSAGLLSAFLQQECITFWEKLLLPMAYCLYFAGVRASLVNTSPRKALANGQFLLVRRELYFEIGGHASIRGSVIDDVALARRFRDFKLPVVMVRGETLGSVRMYRNLRELQAGFSKNAFQFTQVNPWSGVRTILGTIVCFAIAARVAFGPNRLLASALIVGNSGLVAPWYRAFKVPLRYAALHPLGASGMHMIALESVIRTLTRTVQWRGRRLA
jgi:hypothetical protein